MKIAIFASGSGTNAQAIIDAIQQKQLDAEIALIVSDKPQARVVQRADTHQIPTYLFEPKQYATKAEYEQTIVEALRAHRVQFVVLAGYMRLLGATLLDAYENKIVNIHPSLLPAFPGLDAVGQALQAGVRQTGVTIHYVDAGMDTGPVIAQEMVNISDAETKESLAEKNSSG